MSHKCKKDPFPQKKRLSDNYFFIDQSIYTPLYLIYHLKSFPSLHKLYKGQHKFAVYTFLILYFHDCSSIHVPLGKKHQIIANMRDFLQINKRILKSGHNELYFMFFAHMFSVVIKKHDNIKWFSIFFSALRWLICSRPRAMWNL